MAMTAVLGCMSTLALAEGETTPVSASIKVDVLSKYVWRGLNYNNNGVVQPTLTVNYGGFSAFVFGSMDLTDYIRTYAGTARPAGQFMEYDLGLSYSGKCKNIDWSVGAVNYVYPKQGYPQTTEVYASVSIPVTFKPTVTAYYDVEATHGWYGNVSASHSFLKGIRQGDGWLPIDLKASVGMGDANHNRFYYTNGVGAELTDLLLSASCPIPVGKSMTITPAAYYGTLLSDRLRPDGVRRSNMWLGLSFDYKF
jgi:hypothetical protein